MDLAAMSEQARALRARYASFEERHHGTSWTSEEIMLGFVGDVGDLAKLVQGKAGVRPTPDMDAKLAHELADCLWCILTLADCYDVDLEQAFSSTMEQLHGALDRAE